MVLTQLLFFFFGFVPSCLSVVVLSCSARFSATLTSAVPFTSSFSVTSPVIAVVGAAASVRSVLQTGRNFSAEVTCVG